MFRPEFIVDNRVSWVWLSRNPNAIPLLEKKLDKVDCVFLSENPNAIHLIAPLDTEKMRKNCKEFAEKLAAYVFHPTRLLRICETYGLDLEEYFEMV